MVKFFASTERLTKRENGKTAVGRMGEAIAGVLLAWREDGAIS